MEDIRDENRLEQAKASARRAAAKGERAAEAIVDEARDASEDLKKAASKTASRARSAGENAYEEFSDAVEEGEQGLSLAAGSAWKTVSSALRGAWKSTQKELEKNPMRSVVIALAAGVVIGGILASRE